MRKVFLCRIQTERRMGKMDNIRIENFKLPEDTIKEVKDSPQSISSYFQYRYPTIDSYSQYINISCKSIK